MMYNPQLDTFICVVEAGSFSKAAEELYISAPAVIKQINSLENSLNLQLFERTHRGLIITEAGKSLYQDAKYLIQYSKESLIRAQEAMNHNEEIIRVGISPMTPPEVFVELWPKIQKIYPEMKFKLITFENTPENAREILANMGKNIDVIAGIFDETMLELRGCDGTEISREPFCVAVSIHHRLAKKEKITLDDLAGENLMLMRRGWSYYGDMLRDDMMKNHPEINIVDFNLYNVEAFNRCENNNEVLLAFKSWESVHPLIRIIPVEWDYTMPFRANYNDLKNGVHETTEYLELFLRNLLLDEKNELHNRSMHISGRFKETDFESTKADIGNTEADIESQKANIRNKLLAFSDMISEKTINHTFELFSKCGKEEYFGRTIVEDITGLKSTRASELIKLLVDSKVIVSVTGHGKGKYRFQ